MRLPHDAMAGRERSPDLEPATAYFPGGVYQYRKSFTRPEHPDGGRAVVEFEGVYRDAMVYLNGMLAGSHAYGYAAPWRSSAPPARETSSWISSADGLGTAIALAARHAAPAPGGTVD